MNFDAEKVAKVNTWAKILGSGYKIAYLPNIDKVMMWRFRDSKQFFFEEFGEFETWIKAEIYGAGK